MSNLNTRNWKRLLWFFVLCVALLPLAWRVASHYRAGGSHHQSTGGEFDLVGVTVWGQTFQEGSEVRRVLDKFIPRTGLKIGALELKRATRHKDHLEAPMTVWIRYRGAAMRPGRTPPLFGSLVSVRDSAGHEFPNPIPSTRRWRTNEMLISVPLLKFPTTEDQFVLRFSPPPLDPKAREWLEFTVPNPLYLSTLTWSLSPLPETNKVAGGEVILREVTLRPANLELELPSMSWSIQHCVLSDSAGRRLIHRTSSQREALHSIGFEGSIDTNLAWRIDLGLINLDASPTNSHRMLDLSNDRPVENVTNQFGEIFKCTFNGDSLLIAGTSTNSSPARLGWTMIAVTNASTGRPIAILGTAGPHDSASQAWPFHPPSSHVIVHLGYPELQETHFYLTPPATK